MTDRTIAILGVGPGLGMSIARRFGREGFAVALVSRSDVRHAAYRAQLADARTYVADVTNRDALDRVLKEIGEVDTVYYGPASMDLTMVPLAEAGPTDVTALIKSTLEPAVNMAAAVLPRMLERGSGTLFFAGGLSGKYPMPMLGTLAPASAALRMYVMTLAASIRDRGVYAATLTIGGLIERGDIHQHAGHLAPEVGTLDPDAIAETTWQLYGTRDRPEAEFLAPGIEAMIGSSR